MAASGRKTMSCPRCGFSSVDPGTASCPRCGVVFGKLGRQPSPRPRVPAPPPDPPAGDSGALWLSIAALLLAALVGGAYLRFRSGGDSPERPTTPRVRKDPSPTLIPPPALRASAPALPTPPPLPAIRDAVPSADQTLADDLARNVNTGHGFDASQRRAAEELLARYPGQPALRQLLVAGLAQTAVHEASAGHFDEAERLLRRAVEVDPRSPNQRVSLINVFIQATDWRSAEQAARDLLAIDPINTEAMLNLAFALYRQDRNRDAIEVLHNSLNIHETPEARALLARIEKGLRDENGMLEQHLSHFDVRYDGATHEDVGREILRALERHYATLTVALDYQPDVTIPVILFSREQYFNANGAPAWSGANYDNLDGRIRIPIGGLTQSLTPYMDGTVEHEMTHAFIWNRTRGIAMPDVHEGLAQYMEGKRTASEPVEKLRALADVSKLSSGQAFSLRQQSLVGVLLFYADALAFVEYLIDIRGQGGMNDLLRAMGETGSVDEAFQRVYGRDHEGTRRAYSERMQQRYGS